MGFDSKSQIFSIILFSPEVVFPGVCSESDQVSIGKAAKERENP